MEEFRQRMRISQQRSMCLIVLVTAYLFVLGCGLLSSKPLPEPPVPLSQLVPDPTLFPKGWSWIYRHESTPHYDDEYSNYTAGAEFIQKKTTVTIYLLYRYRSVKEASTHYDKFWERDLRSYSTMKERSDLSFQSTIATQSNIQCENRVGDTEGPNAPMCTAIGQYGSYVMVFKTRLGDDKRMSIADIQRILADLDKRLSVLVQP